MKFIKLSNGDVINLSSVIRLFKSTGICYVEFSKNYITVSNSDYNRIENEVLNLR